MSFPRYPVYKASDVEWLGQMPEHWTASRVRRISRRYSGGTPSKEIDEYWQNGTVPWLNSGAVNDRLITEPSTYISESALANSSAKWIPAGSLVMALAGQGKTKGMTAQLAFPATCNQSMAAIVPSAEVEPRFLLWWLDANYQNIRHMAGGNLRDGLNLELLGNIPCPMPPATEQRYIATFLDQETAKIDALLSEQQRLIDLLSEKRRSVISHAVTKGLDSTACMKTSGVQWIGDVPAHWNILSANKLKRPGTTITYGIVQAGPDISGGVPYIRTSDMNGDAFPLDGYLRTTNAIDEAYARSRVRSGDLVVAIRASLGKGLLVPEFLSGANLTQGTAKISPGDKIASEFLSFAFNSHYCQTSIATVAKGSTFLEITLDELRRVPLAVPPLAEQLEIVEYLRGTLAGIDRLSGEAEVIIGLLRERRSALILAAVTGQIDVRGLSDQVAA